MAIRFSVFLAFILLFHFSRYSTWTEARWGSVSMRMFLVDSPSQQVTKLKLFGL